MNKLTDRLQLGIVGNSFLEQVLHRLHIVIGGALNLLDPHCLFQGEVIHQLVENTIGFGTKRCHFLNLWMVGQLLQPANLNQHPVADQSILTEDGSQGIGFASVATIDR